MFWKLYSENISEKVIWKSFLRRIKWYFSNNWGAGSHLLGPGRNTLGSWADESKTLFKLPFETPKVLPAPPKSI